MGKNNVENIFVAKRVLSDFYPQFPGVKTFDLHNKHLLYGRIDKQGDAVYLNDSNLRQIVGANNTTHLVVDFVEAAFSDMRKNVRSAANKGFISKDSLYTSDLRVHKSWTTGDLEYSYDTYLNKLYTTFVNSYLPIDKRGGRIKNQKDFIREFVKFVLRTARLFPLTKTGFLLSSHCSSFVSGLMLEIGNESHSIEQQARLYDYVNDRNFTFFVNEAKKFGFMVDKNAPWRLVFNLASGMNDKDENDTLTGAQLYMNRSAASFDNVFETYYNKAHLEEYINLGSKLRSLYSAFYRQYNTYTVDNYAECPDSSYGTKVKTVRKEREIPGTAMFTSEKEEQEYWLKIILKLRLAETSTMHTPQELHLHSKEVIKRARLFGEEAALNEINNLTKGQHVSTFLSKGHYWYGVSAEEYSQRKAEIEREINSPDRVQYSLTGTKNIK
jgi:hypothetical protein